MTTLSSVHPVTLLPAAASTGVVVPHPVLAHYGESAEANLAIAALLQSVMPESIRGTWGVGQFSADAGDVWAHAYQSDRWRLPLRFFRPYYTTLALHDLCRLIGQSLVDDRHAGRTAFGLWEQDDEFLTDVALPRIISAKIAEAERTGSTAIHVTIKSLGIGDGANEMREIANLAVEVFQHTGASFAGDIHITCLAFDVSLGMLCCIPPTEHTRYETYYADLMDPVSLPTVLAYGRPDITCWRNTHVLMQTNENGFAIVNAIRANLAVPGAMLMYESSRLGTIDVRELVEKAT